MPRLSVEYAVVVQTEYHLGTGLARPGLTDAALHVGAAGEVVLPAETWRGLVRAAGVELARLLGLPWPVVTTAPLGLVPPQQRLGDLAGLADDNPFTRVFGTVHHPRHWRFGDSRATAAGTVEVRSHNQVDARLGRVQGPQFYSYETGPATTFSGRVTRLAAPAEAPLLAAELGLLVSSLLFVEGLGGHRRRDLGRCEVQVVSVDTGELSGVPDNVTALVDAFLALGGSR